MEEFEKGQLVAVRDHAPQEWQLRMFDSTSPGGQAFCRRIPYGDEPKMWWNQIKPAEEVWPELFLARDSEAISEDMNHMRRMRQARGVKTSQVEWLCDVLAKRTHSILDCPPGIEPGDACDCGGPDCAQCWEKASLEAVVEGRDGSED